MQSGAYPAPSRPQMDPRMAYGYYGLYPAPFAGNPEYVPPPAYQQPWGPPPADPPPHMDPSRYPFLGPPGRSIVLPPVSARAASYKMPLPTDCEGLVFALEGKYECGDDMICDAAYKLLCALIDRHERMIATNFEQVCKGRPRSQIIKQIETSWITSSYLAGRLVVIANDMVDSIEASLMKRLSDRGDSNLIWSDLVYLSSELGKSEALLSIVQALERWMQIRFMLGCVETRPGPKKPPKTAKPPVNIFKPNPPDVLPRGRPSRRTMTIGEFADTLESSKSLPMPQPPVRANFYPSMIRLFARFCGLWSRVGQVAQIELAARRMKVLEQRKNGCVETKTFMDPMLNEVFMESVKEAEFQAWRDQRRSSQGNGHEASDASRRTNESVSSDAKVLLSGNGLSMPDLESKKARLDRVIAQVESDDISVTAPLVSGVCVTMRSVFAMASIMTRSGDPSLMKHVVKTIVEAWEIMKQQPHKLGDIPILFCDAGSCMNEPLLQMGWEMCIQSGLDDEWKRIQESFNHICYTLALHCLYCFGEFASFYLFPAVGGSLTQCLAITEVFPAEAFLPVDLPMAQAALLVVLVTVEGLSIPNHAHGEHERELKDLIYRLVYAAWGSAVVVGRVRGFISDPISAAETQDPDAQVLRRLIDNLPPHLKPRVISILKHKYPYLRIEEIPLAEPHSATPNHSPDPLRSNEPDIALGSYTRPTTSNGDQRQTTLIDTTRERCTAPIAEQYSALFESFVHTIAHVLMGIINESLAARRIVALTKPILDHIMLLTKSSSWARILGAMASPGWNLEGSSYFVSELPAVTQELQLCDSDVSDEPEWMPPSKVGNMGDV